MGLNLSAGREHPSIAVLIPCYNEELTIGQVVSRFRDQLPHAKIYVFDNNSTDRTIEEAKAAGALIGYERRQGKGYVVQSMFGRIGADVYVMVDGEGTYPAEEIHKLLSLVLADEADMVVGSRLHAQSDSQFKFLNRYFPIFPLVFLALGFCLGSNEVKRWFRYVALGFVLVTCVVNALALSNRVLDREREATVARLRDLFPLVNENTRIFVPPQDQLWGGAGRLQFEQQTGPSNFHVDPIAILGTVQVPQWKSDFAQATKSEWNLDRGRRPSYQLGRT